MKTPEEIAKNCITNLQKSWRLVWWNSCAPEPESFVLAAINEALEQEREKIFTRARQFEEAKAFSEKGASRVRKTRMPKGQKYPPGTRVRIADDLGPSMSHFPAGVNATVLYTYAHAFGGNDVASYCLDVDGEGEISWYEEHQLTKIKNEKT